MTQIVLLRDTRQLFQIVIGPYCFRNLTRRNPVVRPTERIVLLVERSESDKREPSDGKRICTVLGWRVCGR